MFRFGFDIGGTSIKLAIVRIEDDNHGTPKLIKAVSDDFPKGQDPIIPIRCMAGMVEALLRDIFPFTPPHDIEGMGIAVAGSVNEEEGLVIDAHNLGFHNMPLLQHMKSYYPPFKMALANDADAATLGELRAGALKGVKTGVVLTLGTGVGGGIVLNGELFKGGLGHGNELGHMTLMHDGPRCTCGNKGCIESLCSATWLISAGEKAGLGKDLGAKDVIDLAKEGHTKALEIFNEYLDYLSSALTSIAVFLDPEVIVLGGGVAEAGDFLFEPLRDLVEAKSFFKYRHEIVPAKLGKDAGVIGATCLLDK